MDTFLFQIIINGIVIGSVYALVALGLNLIWSITDIPDFSQGGIYVIAAYVGYFAVVLFELPFFLGLLAAICVGATTSFLCEKLLYRRWRGDVLVQLLCGIALFFLMANLAILMWTPKAKFFPEYFPGEIALLGLHVSFQRIIAVAVASFLFVLTYLFIMKTKIGKAIRATSQDKEIAQMVGINIDTVYSVTFILGGALSATAAMVIAPLYAVTPGMGNLPLLKSMVVVLLGGFGSFAGVLVGGIGLGIVESLGGVYISTAYQHGYAFFLLLLVLLFKPKGLFGRV